MSLFYCKERHIFLYYNQEEATRAARSFPLTTGIHKDSKVAATKTTPEVTSLEMAAQRANHLEVVHGFTVTYLPSGHVFKLLRSRVTDGLDANVCHVNQIQLLQGNIDAWTVNGATYEPYVEISAMGECMIVNGKIC